MSIVRIPLGSRKYPGNFALIDEEDYERVSQYHWTISKSEYTFYAVVRLPSPRAKPEMLIMHRFIMDAPDDIEVDHQDRNGLNNVRTNLRLATRAQNMANGRLRRTNTSGYRGVTFHKQTGKWSASIRANGECYGLGLYDTREEAAQAYDTAARHHFGAFASCNFPNVEVKGKVTISTNTSGYRGVCLHSKTGKWRAEIIVRHQRHNLGLFSDAKSAAQAYDAKAKELLGMHARMNFPDE